MVSPPWKYPVTLGHHLISLGKRKISDTFEPTGTTWINLSTKPSPWTVAVDRGSPKKFVTRGRSQGAPWQWLAEAGHVLETPASLKPHKKLDTTSPPKKHFNKHQHKAKYLKDPERISNLSIREENSMFFPSTRAPPRYPGLRLLRLGVGVGDHEVT